MQQQQAGPSPLENNFSKGLLTEYTGLNFPENAATATSNCVYTLIGDVTRREGFDYETDFQLNATADVGAAVATYKWNNASGDGLTQFVVQQNGPVLSFFRSSTATVTSPLSTQLVGSVNISGFVATGGTFDPTQECQFADGNGYLFVFQATINPIYIQYTASPLAFATNVINIQIRDTVGLIDGLGLTTRPLTLSTPHNYNIQNQGWTSGNSVSATSQTVVFSQDGSTNFTIASGLTIPNGTIMQCYATIGLYFLVGFNPAKYQLSTTISCLFTGSVTGYSGTTLTLNVYSTQLSGSATDSHGNVITPTANNYGGDGVTFVSLNGTFYGLYSTWAITSLNTSVISTWFSDEGNYPSNSDVWWYFKDDTGVFNPTTTQPNVTVSTGSAPEGHFLMPAFNLDRTAASGITGITPVTTTARPSTGCWYQGRVWYTGCNSSFSGNSMLNPYSWTETIYYSTVVTSPQDFGTCYQQNDPTSENLFDLLPSDGGTIQIQGCGAIYKLFPIMNALLVFAANGIWYISGNSGIGFTADDSSIVEFSHVRSISSTSFTDINGYPIFWNEEGIYKVSALAQGQSPLNDPVHVVPLAVTPITVGTIQTYYDNIPLQSKLYARGCYDPINYIVQWVYRSTQESGVSARYQYDTVLNLNTYNQAFYPYNFDTSTNNPPTISSIIYVQSPGGTTAPDSTIKYLVTDHAGVNTTYAEEQNDLFIDWAAANVSNNYSSSFTTGYRLHGQGLRRFQMPYIYVYQRMLQPVMAYNIQSVWDFAIDPNSNRWSTLQNIVINNNKFGMIAKRHRLRGRGLVLQIQVTSVDGKPFDIMGWSAFETLNQSV